MRKAKIEERGLARARHRRPGEPPLITKPKEAFVSHAERVRLEEGIRRQKKKKSFRYLREKESL